MKLLLSEEDLKEEIDHLEKQKRVYGICNRSTDELALEPNMFFEPTLSLLLQWCKAVCVLYGVPVSGKRNAIHSICLSSYTVFSLSILLVPLLYMPLLCMYMYICMYTCRLKRHWANYMYKAVFYTVCNMYTCTVHMHESIIQCNMYCMFSLASSIGGLLVLLTTVGFLPSCYLIFLL